METTKGENYATILTELKTKIRQARIRAGLAVNKELLQTYWEIGKTILQQQEQEGWGAKVIERLVRDLRLEFPDFQGLSSRNLNYMRAFAEAYPDFPNVQAPLAQLPQTAGNAANNHIMQVPLARLTWYHHITLLEKVKDPDVRLFYILKSIENGWSRNTMVHFIESGLHTRQGTLISNFDITLPPDQSDLVRQLFKDPYHFDFLQVSQKVHERDIEKALIRHIRQFLLELGEGFAFMGEQFALKVNDREYNIDLLFYHTRLRRYVVVDLKVGDFEAEFAGKMNFYLGIADDTIKGPQDESTIGLILCKTRNKAIVEYALRDIHKPIGISQYKITDALPENVKGGLPSIEELEKVMNEEIARIKQSADNRLFALKEKLEDITSKKENEGNDFK